MKVRYIVVTTSSSMGETTQVFGPYADTLHMDFVMQNFIKGLPSWHKAVIIEVPDPV